MGGGNPEAAPTGSTFRADKVIVSAVSAVLLVVVLMGAKMAAAEKYKDMRDNIPQQTFPTYKVPTYYQPMYRNGR